MRVRDHVAIATAAAALARRWGPRRAAALWAGSVLIDADHYAWYCLRERRVSPLAAVRAFNGAHGPQHRATRAMHSPLALAGVAVLAARRPWLRPVALGMGLHVGLDSCHQAALARARAAALARDSFACTECGARTPGVRAHVRRQPPVLPSYAPRNLVSLCEPCHEQAHARGKAG